MDSAAVIAEVLESTWRDFFSETGASVTLLADNGHSQWRNGDSVAATIGFAGNTSKGSLLVIGPVRLFMETHPNPSRRDSLSDDEICDWAGETANQLLGRIKQGFLKRGLDFRMSTPMVLRGNNVVRIGENRAVTRVTGTVGNNPVLVALEVISLTDAPLFSETHTNDESLNGGDFLLL